MMPAWRAALHVILTGRYQFPCAYPYCGFDPYTLPTAHPQVPSHVIDIWAVEGTNVNVEQRTGVVMNARFYFFDG